MGRRDLFGIGRRAEAAAGHWIRVQRRAMACQFEVTLSNEDHRHIGAAHESLREAGRLEAAWTVFADTSILSDVNRRAALETVAVDAELFTLLARCRQLHLETDGAFDVTSTPLSRCWGFLARQGRVPEPDAIANALAAVGMSAIELDAAARTVRFGRPGMSINLGSIGKGYAVGAIAATLRAQGVGHALVSAGGSSIVALGGRHRGWSIDLTSRHAPRSRLARIWLRDGAISTSGAGEQFIDVDGRRFGHIIDPRSGWPASGLLSVTTFAADPATAEALSTAFFVGGVALARRYCETHPGVMALVTPDETMADAASRDHPAGPARRADRRPRTEAIGHATGVDVEVL